MAPLFTAGAAGDSSLGSGCLDPLLVACFLGAGASGGDSSALERLDPLLVVSFVTAGSSGDDSLDTGRLDPRLFSFLTAGVLGFFAGAPLLTGVALDGDSDSFLEADCFFADLLAEDAAFLAGDFFASGRPLPLAFDWLELGDFLGGGGRRALGGGLFSDFLRVILTTNNDHNYAFQLKISVPLIFIYF